MKEIFEEPKFDVIFVDDVDIITGSCADPKGAGNDIGTQSLLEDDDDIKIF